MVGWGGGGGGGTSRFGGFTLMRTMLYDAHDRTTDLRVLIRRMFLIVMLSRGDMEVHLTASEERFQRFLLLGKQAIQMADTPVWASVSRHPRVWVSQGARRNDHISMLVHRAAWRRLRFRQTNAANNATMRGMDYSNPCFCKLQTHMN